MATERHSNPHGPTPLWVTFESDPQRPTSTERLHLVVAVLYPEEVKYQHASLEAGEARAVEIGRETLRELLGPTPGVGSMLCTVAQAGPGNLPQAWPHRLLADGTKVWLAEGERS